MQELSNISTESGSLPTKSSLQDSGPPVHLQVCSRFAFATLFSASKAVKWAVKSWILTKINQKGRINHAGQEKALTELTWGREIGHLLLLNSFAEVFQCPLHPTRPNLQTCPLLMHRTHPRHFQEGPRAVKGDFCDLQSGSSGKMTYFQEVLMYTHICASDTITQSPLWSKQLFFHAHFYYFPFLE